jgi:Zn-dependent protease
MGRIRRKNKYITLITTGALRALSSLKYGIHFLCEVKIIIRIASMELSTIQIVAVSVVPVLFAITVHEVAHGWVALFFGDQTARLSGRLTLNPMKHIDLIGTIIVPLVLLLMTNFIFGWAKPVPVDARNMRNPRWNMAVVAAAGPAINLFMAFFWAFITKLSLLLNGSSEWLGTPLVYMGEVGIVINIVLAVLNVLPIPPLDGGRILASLLPPRMAWQLHKIEPYIFLLVVILMLTGIISYLISPPIAFLIGSINQLFGLPALFI